MKNQIWTKTDENFDLFFTNDAGKDTNLSQLVRDAIEKVDACLLRYMKSRYVNEWDAGPETMEVGDDEWLLLCLTCGDTKGLTF